MARTITIALDAMGGDNAPDIVVGGAGLASAQDSNVRFLLYGDEVQLKPLLERCPGLADRSEIRHTDQVVTSSDQPSQAVRRGRKSSMWLAIQAVKDGEADGVVSAGNTGALMAMSKLQLRSLDGIDRPAICTTLPTKTGKTVVLDLGANVDCSAENLVQFALMGAVFARTVLHHDQPTVGLLNIGEEEIKGSETLKNAAAILRDSDLPMEFVGFVEGDDITNGSTDVVVTDGFTGNVALKAAEGAAGLYTEFLKSAFSGSLMARIGYLFARSAMLELKKKVDPRYYNGAVFIGLNGISVKSHGGMDDFGFSSAINVAIELVADNVNDRIIKDLRRYGGAARAAE